jgi:hypothetical protein
MVTAMESEQTEQLRRQYTDQYVVVQGDRPELARFLGAVGQVKTVNCSGRALVQFDANNSRAWHDIDLAYLQVVAKPEPKPVAEKKPCPTAAAKAAGTSPDKPSA